MSSSDFDPDDHHWQWLEDKEQRYIREGYPVSQEHKARFRCDGCGKPLELMPAHGIGKKTYHWECTNDRRK